MQVPKETKEKALQRLNDAWKLRCRGWRQERIAAELGITQQAVSKLLASARRRMKGDVEAFELEHVGQLNTAIEESFDAWFKSKEPLRRVRQTTDAEGKEVTVTEAIEREGSVAYLDRVLAAMDRKAKVLGLNVADAVQEQAFTISSLAADMNERAKAYEARSAEAQAGDTVSREADPGSGASEVQDGPGPVQ